MHPTNFTVLSSCWVVGPWPLSDPAGASDLHDRSADANCGELVMLAGKSNVPSAVGSGKFASPCARMHCANCTGLDELVFGVPAAPAPAVAELELPGESPHAEAASAATTTTATKGAVRLARRSLTGTLAGGVLFISSGFSFRRRAFTR
jgi:hypothetical protein